MKRVIALAALASLAVAIPLAAADTPAKEPRQVSVEGTGRVKAAPDLARVSVEVIAEAVKSEDAALEERRKAEAVLKALKAQGVADKDIQTSAYRITPRMRWDKGRTSIDGFTASNRVEVLIHDLKKAGAVLAAVVSEGANSVSGPSFEFEDARALERQALAAAMADAKAKAELLAKAAGATLGEVLSVTESAGAEPRPRPMMMMKAAAMAGAEAEPISAGEDTVAASVRASFALR